MNRTAVILFALICILFYLAKPVSGQTWDRDAVYAARVAEFQAAIAARQNDPQPLADLAAFYRKPLAPRDIQAADGKVRRVMVPLRNEVRGSIKDIVAVSWVWRGDPALALPLAKQALALNPGHPTAVRAMAMPYRMKGDPRPLGRRRQHADRRPGHPTRLEAVMPACPTACRVS